MVRDYWTMRETIVFSLSGVNPPTHDFFFLTTSERTDKDQIPTQIIQDTKYEFKKTEGREGREGDI